MRTYETRRGPGELDVEDACRMGEKTGPSEGVFGWGFEDEGMV